MPTLHVPNQILSQGACSDVY
jgi:hypothetical protein